MVLIIFCVLYLLVCQEYATAIQYYDFFLKFALGINIFEITAGHYFQYHHVIYVYFESRQSKSVIVK